MLERFLGCRVVEHLLEGLLQMGLDRPSAFIGARPGAQRVAGMVIEQGQQMHPVSGGAQRQMPHEIHLPQLVRRRSLEELRPLPLGGGVGGNQSMPMQDVGNGARRWQRGDALRLEQPLQLASPQAGYCARSATTRASVSAAVWVGDCRGRRERSCAQSPSAPSARSRHL